MEELFKKGISFIQTINHKDKILLIYHKDLDGLTSALIFLKYAKRNGIKILKRVPSSNEEIDEIIKKIKSFDKILIFDIDISYMKKKLVKVNKEMLIIDHHPPRANLNTKKIVYINPRLLNPKIYQPTSYITYKLVSKISNVKDEEWLAVLGTISDYGIEDCEDLIRNWTKIKKKEEIQKTKIWKQVEELIGIISEFGFSKTLNLLEKVKSFDDFKKKKVVKKALKDYKKKKKIYEKIFWKNIRKFKSSNLLISEMETKHREITSLISTKMSIKFPENVIVIFRKSGEKYAVNVRYNGSKEIDLGKIMEKCAKGLNGGGGHQSAAGATIKAKNKEIFEKRLIEEVKKFFKVNP
ncbi:MAG: DHHA1 domain-containing protein [Candidatus Aenigmatarchaeota archaeon]